jgi:mono/diheme cytochrome c family protein
MQPAEIEQVIDYVIFLSMRGETERGLITEAALADKDDPSGLAADTIKDIVDNVVNNWKAVDGLVVQPKARRQESSRESILRGRNIFLGINTTGQKVACTDCHGARGTGNGTSFVEKAVFDKVVFERKSIEEAIEIRYRELEDQHASAEIPLGEGHGHSGRGTLPEAYDAYKSRELTNWEKGSKDDWGNPLRPANLNLGVYKGGRRPIDLYWRIAKGINGAKMPSHASLLPDDQIWDVVNFILALPYEPELLKDADALKQAAAKLTAVTQR